MFNTCNNLKNNLILANQLINQYDPDFKLSQFQFQTIDKKKVEKTQFQK